MVVFWKSPRERIVVILDDTIYKSTWCDVTALRTVCTVDTKLNCHGLYGHMKQSIKRKGIAGGRRLVLTWWRRYRGRNGWGRHGGVCGHGVEWAPRQVVSEVLPRRAGVHISGRRNEYLICLTRRFQEGSRAAGVMASCDAFALDAATIAFPDWFYVVWGAGRLVPLVKARPAPGAPPDARPIVIIDPTLQAVLKSLVQPAASAGLAAFPFSSVL